MKFRSLIPLILLVCFYNLSYGQLAGPAKADTLYAQQLKPYGRYTFTAQKQLELVSSAVHFGFSFKGNECVMYASLTDTAAHNYLQYELDGVYQKRIRINGNTNAPIVIKATGTGEHTVWVYKATEAHTGGIFISKIAANKVKALKVQKAPLIEFIGNSITCGAAADASEVACGAGAYHDQHNAYMAYGPRLARDLKVNYMLSSVSGIGIYRNWNSDSPIMPQVYDKVNFQENSTRMWDFSTYTPKVVSIALGTNDLSKGDGKKFRKPFDADVFVSSYVKFVQQIKAKYPKAQIALLSSPMAKGDNRVLLQNCLASVKQKIDAAYPADKPVATFFFEPMDPHGCTGHPDVDDHRIMAEQLKPFFKKLLQ